MMKRTKKPTYYQMFDRLAAKYGYKFMLELRSEDQQTQAANVEKAFLATLKKEQEEVRHV
jgi:cupin superfamily acireductone dioxygenase involved in methionine salvage